MKSAPACLLRQMAELLGGGIVEQLCREAAERERRELRPNELVSYHEAGHADLRMCFGFDLAELRLLDDPRIDGICLPRPWDGSVDLNELPSDEWQVNQIFISLHVCGFVVCLPRLKRVIRRLLKKHWANITKVAECLLAKESGSVDKSEIDAALASTCALRREAMGTTDYIQAAAALAKETGG